MSTISAIPDLWPTDFNVGSEPSPATILRQQGYILGERTKDVVYGEVESSMAGEGSFRHSFFVSAPYCKVRQLAIIASHELQSYPARLTALGAGGRHLQEATAENAERFSELLRTMLATPHIVQLVGSLITQARDADDE